jgi:flavin reductase (DIM6/NTAB) family NADH-FMN oxidoreductase RutF
MTVVDAQAFKQAMAQFASGVTIVTTVDEGVRYGMTVAAFSSVSLTPPMALVCIANSASARGPIERAGRFAVNILGQDQVGLGARFAGMVKGVVDRFDGVATREGITGSPILLGCLAVVECRLRHAYPGGDHTIFVGDVVFAEATPACEALLHYSRNFRSLAAEHLRHE